MPQNLTDTILDSPLPVEISHDLDRRAARLRALWRMTPTQRVTAMRRGDLSLQQCAAWAARHPEQIPLINGEFEYLAAFTPDVYELPENLAKRAKFKHDKPNHTKPNHTKPNHAK